jgi:surface antigen
VNRTVGVTLRRTVGGGTIFALGFGALSTQPAAQPLAAAAAAATAAAPAVPTRAERPEKDPPVAHADQPVVTLYVRVAPEATAPAWGRVPGSTPSSSRPVAPAGVAPARPRTVAGASSGAAFAYGYCTWWVAHKRPIPWRGNAAQWWWNARAFGFAEGSVPRPGAIMVMGVSGTSPQGHVGYVESVNANGSFTVSEMNWWGVPGGGWGRVDYRTLTSMGGILGFIY